MEYINDDFDIEKSLKYKKMLEERIYENKRLVNMLQNPGLREQQIIPIDKFKMFFAARKLQKYWRKYINAKKQKALKKSNVNNSNIYSVKNLKEKEYLFNDLSNSKINFKGNLNYVNNIRSLCPNINTFITNANLIGHIIFIQRSFKKYLKKRNLINLKLKYTKDYTNEVLGNINLSNCSKIKQTIFNNIKTDDINKYKNEEYRDYLTDKYFYSYKNYNEEFPYHIDERNRNYTLFNKSIDGMSYLEKDQDINNPENLIKFKNFYFDSKLEREINCKVDKIINNLDKNINRHDYQIDDFEERNMIDEIDNIFGYKSFEDIIYK